MGPNIWAPAGSKPGNPTLMNQFLNGTPDSHAAAAQAPQERLDEIIQPARAAKPTPEQEPPWHNSGNCSSRVRRPSRRKNPGVGQPVFFSSPPRRLPHRRRRFRWVSFAPLSGGIAMPAGPPRCRAFWSNQRAGAGVRAGMETPAAAVDVVAAATRRDSAAQILMRGSNQEDLFEG